MLLLLFRPVSNLRSADKFMNGAVVSIPRAEIVWARSVQREDKTNQDSFLRALEGAGFSVGRVGASPSRDVSTSGPRILVVPAHAAREMNPKDLPVIVQYVDEGGLLILDTPTLLSDALGIRTQGNITVRSAYFCSEPQAGLRWPSLPATLSWAAASPRPAAWLPRTWHAGVARTGQAM